MAASEQVPATPMAVTVNAGGANATGFRCGGTDGSGMGTTASKPSLPSWLILVSFTLAILNIKGFII